MRNVRIPILVLALLGIVAAAGGASAEAYSYVDADGKMHFVDSLHAVPPEYRGQVANLDAEIEAEAETPLGRYDGWRRDSTRDMVALINMARELNGQNPLNHGEKREVATFIRTAMPWMIVSHALLFIVWGLVVIHGFMSGHPGWAIANLILWLPIPIYCMLHVGEESRWLKWTTSAISLAPVVAICKVSWDSVVLLTNLGLG